jgi:predicted dehydrogenase
VTPALRVGVIGTGNFGAKHIAAYARRPDVELVGVVDRDLGRAETVAQQWGISRWFSDTAELLRECRPDGVSVVTSGSNHLQPALAALAEGCCVLLEKPLTLSTGEADELAEAERSSRGFVMPAHILRFAGPYRELVTHVHRGEIGRVLAVATARDRGRDHEVLFPDVHPALMTTIHDIDVALWVTGSRALRVSAQGRGGGAADRPLLLWAQVEAADGSVWALHVSWLLSDDAPSVDRLEVYGTAGVAKLALRPAVAVFTDRSLWVDHELTPDAHAGALDAEIASFCGRIRAPTLPPVVTLEEARHGIQIAEAIITSAGRGGDVVELTG